MRRGLYVLLGVLLVPTVGLVGDVVTDGKFKSTMSTGAPLEVTSASMVANLNADMVDGLEASDLAWASDTYTMAEVDALVAAAIEAGGARMYYVTNTTYAADVAPTACESGFHMASMFEVIDPSSLRYATELSSAWKFEDSGTGPPGAVQGWIRIGLPDLSSSLPGTSNCWAWSSTSDSDYGTVVYLLTRWDDESVVTGSLIPGSMWKALTDTCDQAKPVWCIED